MLFRRTSNVVVEEKEESLEEPEQYKLGLGGVARSLPASRKPVSWPAATKNGNHEHIYFVPRPWLQGEHRPKGCICHTESKPA